jgi:hypothetical protein
MNPIRVGSLISSLKHGLGSKDLLCKLKNSVGDFGNVAVEYFLRNRVVEYKYVCSFFLHFLIPV